MTKNARFKKHYKITVEGITTNGYSERYIEEVLHAFISAVGAQKKQVDVRIEELK